jgi:hypothetical protein
MSRKRRQGEVKDLPTTGLQAALESAITSQGSAELALLYLIENFGFSLDELESRLQGSYCSCLQVTPLNVLRTEKRLQVSFSKVKYPDVAPLVGLDFSQGFHDAPTFEMKLARLPTRLFKEIVEDVQLILKQYGPPDYHCNERASSRFFAPVSLLCGQLSEYVLWLTNQQLFNRTVAQFSSLLSNTPESTIPGRMATKGRMEYHYTAFGALTILFIEVKLLIGNAEEFHDAIAQVIAESVGKRLPCHLRCNSSSCH